MKKMSSKKMISVIEAMLNIDNVWCCLLSAMVVCYLAGSLSKSMNSIVLPSSLFMTLLTREVR